ncbi:MAG: creatininase family protein [Abditibacteriaceae bacterium]
MPKAPPYLYAKLTWPEINDAIAAEKVCVIPVGSIEQHGPHLPLDVDCVCPTGVAMHAAELIPDKVLILPTIPHGYTGHVMDFPGTINHHYEHFIQSVLDVVKSLAYHGFKKIILLNGHGSNMPNLDLVARRANLETDAECCLTMWTDLLKVDPKFMPSWRESYFPGGCAHACELETSA